MSVLQSLLHCFRKWAQRWGRRPGGRESYRSTGDHHFHLSFCRAHQSAEFVTHALEQAEAVVLGQCGEKVLDRAGLVGAAGVLFKFGDDLGLVGVGECGRREDGL